MSFAEFGSLAVATFTVQNMTKNSINFMAPLGVVVPGKGLTKAVALDVINPF